MKTSAVILMLLTLGAQCMGAPTAGKPTNVQLTIYNQNFALVKEERAMTLDNGINFVEVQDVAATIEAPSVAFKSLTAPTSVVVREQNYQYDVINPDTILNKSVGKRVKVRRVVDGKIVEIEGVLLNPATVTLPTQPGYEDYYRYNPNQNVQKQGIVIQTASGILLNPTGEIEVLELPDGLVSKPTLVWKLETNKPGAHQTEISYLANNMSWVADYVAVVDPLDKYVDLTGWVTLINNAGVTYENASLNLMAGDVNRIQPKFKGDQYWAMAEMPIVETQSVSSQFQEKSFFEYHLYTLQGKTTVRDKETKQITLMTAAKIPAKKVYIYDARKSWWSSYRYNTSFRPGESYDVSANKKVSVLMEVMNNKENNLGIPLPKGKIKVYKQEADANQHFIGEDQIDHTPKDEKIRLYLGDAFDIVGEHKRTNFRRISSHEIEESFEITLRNHKDTAVTINVVEHLFLDWEITESSHKTYKKDASTLEIPVEVAKDGEVKITYTARTRWP